MSDNSPSAASLLDRIDLARDDSQIVRTISSILKASDYPQLVSTFQTEITQPPPEKAVKFVNALDKARFSRREAPRVSSIKLTRYICTLSGAGIR